MNLSNMLGVVKSNATMFYKQHGPKIWCVLGVGLGVGATVLACKATLKAADDVGDAKSELEAINETLEKKKEYTEEAAEKDRKRVKITLAKNLVKDYAIPAGMGVASIASIGYGMHILNDQKVANGLAATGAMAALKDVRDNLIKKYGEDEGKKIYNELRYGLKEEETKETYIEDGKKKTRKGKLMVIDNDSAQRDISYVRRFDWHNPYYNEEDPEYNLFLVRSQQNYYNERLRAFRHIWTNEVDKALGFKERKSGQTTGWLYDPTDPMVDNFVDFNIQEVWETDEYGVKRQVIYLEYNCDGSILDRVQFDE